MADTDTQNPVTRRRVVQIGAATVLAPSFVNVAQADTASGNVELAVTATVPADTTVEITIYEDTNSSGSANRQQTQSISDGTNTIEYDLLESTTAQGDVLWMELSLSTADDAVTPSVDSATITLPETVTTPTATDEPAAEQPTDPQGLDDLWQNYYAFVAFVVLAFASIGLWGRSLALGAFVAYLAFAYIAITTGTALFVQLLYVTAILVFVGVGFKLYRAEFAGE